MSQHKWEELIQKLIRSGILHSPEVIRAFRQVPREFFLPEKVKANAAMDCPLPIGSGQTASAPLSWHSVVIWAKHGFNNG
jgi:protein-L-isoaspartate(D-aspartate) O-methyltransferase